MVLEENDFVKAVMLSPFNGYRIYLASPYSNKFRHRERWNVEAATWVANFMISGGIMVNSPITHGDAIYEASLRTGMNLPKDFAFWKKICLWGIESSDILCILMLDGWADSVGLNEEIKYASSLNKPIVEVYPELIPGFIEYMNSWSETFNKN